MRGQYSVVLAVKVVPVHKTRRSYLSGASHLSASDGARPVWKRASQSCTQPLIVTFLGFQSESRELAVVEAAPVAVARFALIPARNLSSML